MRRPKLLGRLSVTNSLLTQLIVGTIVPVVALLLILIAVGVFGFNRMTQALVEQRDAELVQLATRQIADHWADSVMLLSQVASREAVRSGDLQGLQAVLQENDVLRQRFDEISITDAFGNTLATVGGAMGENVGQLSFFERARRLRRPVRSQVYVDSRGNRVIAVGQPVYDIYGRFAGCVVGIWHLYGSQLGVPVANVRVGEHGYAFLVDEFGMILYHPDSQLIGADASHHPAVEALLHGQIGAQTVNVNGETTVVGYAPIPLRRLNNSLVADESWDGWGLLTADLWNEIVAPLQPFVRALVVLSVLLVALPSLILVLNSRRIVAPLSSLVNQVELVSSGEFDTQVSINAGPREVRELELAFNRMVDQLRRYRQDIQNYVVSILNTQEEERKRIARELHDETAQALVVLGRKIEMVEDLVEDPELINELERLRDMVDDTLQGVRRFTSDLRPPLLEELGLSRTLEILASRTEREEPFSIDVEILGEPRQLLPELELGLYRMAQESLSNVRRHAQATHVDLTLIYDDKKVVLQIADNGVGFTMPTEPGALMHSGRLGLMGIHERARLFGGKATITSKPNEGTVVRVEVPLTAIVLPRAEDVPQERESIGV
ncbi:MAG: HAMP domain-containing protein [Chloroflexi bacterium]|nr:HAMP domain-containing protein [Chloroflexota bacterium]